MALIENLKEEQKLAMKAKDKPRLGAIRLVLAAIKQREVDEQITLSDDDIVAVLTKMVKQRRDSVSQYEAAGRQDLADAEKAEITVLEEFMPQPLSDDEVKALIDSAITFKGVQTWVK
ncbi:transamidase GatB domain protein [Vibrio cholerae]|nr:transamidase GatB domain protein [Vibrio cholerae]